MCGKVEINIIDRHELSNYDNLVLVSNEGTIFHSSWWHQAVCEGYRKRKFQTVYLGAYNKKGELIGAFPLFLYKVLSMKVITAPPLTPYLGPLFKPLDTDKPVSLISYMKNINRHYAKILKKIGIVSYYPFSHEHTDLQPYLWEGFEVHVRYTYIIDMKLPLSEIWKNMDKRRKWEIRKALKSNIQIKEESTVNTFIALFNESMKRHGVKVNYDKVWESVFNECSRRGVCKILSAYLNTDEVLSSIFIVWDKKRVYYLGSGMKPNSYGATSLLIWKALELAKKTPVKEFDFEGSSIPYIEEYFRKFGGRIIGLQYIKSKSILIDLTRKLKKIL